MVNRSESTQRVNRSIEAASGKGFGCGVPEVLKALRDTDTFLALKNIPSTALNFLAARLLQEHRRPLLVIAPTDRQAELSAEEISYFLGPESSGARRDQPLERRVWRLLSRSGHKAQKLGKARLIADRLAALHALRHAMGPLVLVASAAAVMERLMPVELLASGSEYLVVGEEIDPDGLCRRLTERGYYPVALAEEYGDLSRRGDLLDVYSPLYPWPLRLEFFGNELQSIRMFHPVSQRSVAALEDALLLPASEVLLGAETKQRARNALLEDVRAERLSPSAGNAWLEKLNEGLQPAAFEPVLSAFYQELVPLTAYLEASTLAIWTDLPLIQTAAHEFYDDALKHYADQSDRQQWRRPPDEWLLPPEEILNPAGPLRSIWCNPLSLPDQSAPVIDLGISEQHELQAAVKAHASTERLLDPLVERFHAWQREGLCCRLLCARKERAERYVTLLESYGLGASLEDRFIPGGSDYGAVLVAAGPLKQGFLWPAENLAVVCEEEIQVGRRVRRRPNKPVQGLFLNSFQDLRKGDSVVHVDHGIAVYRGLVHLTVGRLESDFLHLEYQDGDKLYVPVDRLQKVQKYLGIEGQDPAIDRLGGRSWEAAKNKAKESAERIAQELIKTYALRQVREGHRFSPPDSLFREFETTFPFDETPDQLNAIDDVLADMTSERPMDRLICGDVGYGKTEVALRAAFKAIMDGKQVAMLVPTTVLAEQHFQTFKERFQPFPIVVEALSRFKTAKQQRDIVAALERGTIDLVIGTHRLLQSDVKFRDLGLMIVDEEHRFGVKHKERLKDFRVAVDVLTLTATPIPRTLHMALSGIRDLSTIETPPEDRRAIETYVSPYDEITIKAAIHRELERHGQIFFVHNHVQSIARMAIQLRRLVPEARIGTAHGQMKERELEQVMLDFIQRRIDILLCTTIIESGLDIPAANTIIINRADRLGLSQIYQLRGRVGRSNEQAFAYLLIPGEHLVSRDAQKRLRALMDFSELGAGFKIALNDLQIRGGGTILGAQQSGHIAAVGYELYLELLEKTVRELKGERTEAEQIDPEINIPVAAFLPDSFMPDPDQRLLAYKRLAAAADETVVDDLAREWRDRCGPLPDQAKALLLLAKVRILMPRLGVIRLEGDEARYLLVWAKPVNGRCVIDLLEREKCLVRAPKPDKIVIEIGGSGALNHLARIKRILHKLLEHDSDIKSIQ